MHTTDTYNTLKEQHSISDINAWVSKNEFVKRVGTKEVKTTRTILFICSLVCVYFGYSAMHNIVFAAFGSNTISVFDIIITIVMAWATSKIDSSVRSLSIDLKFRKLIDADNLSETEITDLYNSISNVHTNSHNENT